MQIPVIKVGNIVVGGAGKTPTAISIAKRLINLKMNVHLISKGYKGSIRITTKVDNLLHKFNDVGDEALLLSNYIKKNCKVRNIFLLTKKHSFQKQINIQVKL